MHCCAVRLCQHSQLSSCMVLAVSTAKTIAGISGYTRGSSNFSPVLMPLIPDALALRPDFWFLLTLPFVLAVMGWVVNRAVLLFLFGPLPLRGIWQHGLLAARSRDLPAVLGGELARHLQMVELFRLMEPEKIAAHLGDSVRGRLDEYVDDVMSERHAVLWDNLPQLLRRRIYERVRRQLPSMLDNMIDDMAENIEAMVDVRSLVEEVLGRDPALLSAIFKEALQQEQAFLLRAGVWTGLLGGLVLAVLWWYLPRPLLLPVMMAGLLLVSCWLPRELLLRGRLPAGLGAGWLHRHRAGALAVLACRLSEDVLNLRSLMRALLSGSRAVRTRTMIRRHLRPLLDAGVVRTTIQLTLGVQGYVDIKQQVLERTASLTMGSLSDGAFNHERAGVVHDACADHLAALDVVALEQIMRPVLQHGWWWQVLLVAGLGLLAGAAQWLWLL